MTMIQGLLATLMTTILVLLAALHRDSGHACSVDDNESAAQSLRACEACDRAVELAQTISARDTGAAADRTIARSTPRLGSTARGILPEPSHRQASSGRGVDHGSGSAASAAAATTLTTEAAARQLAHLLLVRTRLGGPGGSDFGRPPWNGRYEAFLQKPSGRRWRLGEIFWPTLDTNMPLTIAGVEVPVGLYYAVQQHDPEHGIALVLLDPGEVRRRRLDAFEAPKTEGGRLVPLQLGPAEPAASRRQIELQVDRSLPERATRALRFGPYALAAAVQMHPHR